jgi:uncharacterized protein YjbJ (UPF0337 family)
MKFTDRLGDGAQQAKGKLKEVFGKATKNQRLETEGKNEQAKVKLKVAARKVKGAIKDVFD